MSLKRRHLLLRKAACWLYGHDPDEGRPQYQSSKPGEVQEIGPGVVMPGPSHWRITCKRCRTVKVERFASR